MLFAKTSNKLNENIEVIMDIFFFHSEFSQFFECLILLSIYSIFIVFCQNHVFYFFTSHIC